MPQKLTSEHIKLFTTGVIVTTAITATIAIVYKAIKHVQIQKEVRKDSIEFSEKYESMLSDASKMRLANSKEDTHANRISTDDGDNIIDDRSGNKNENDLVKSKSSAANDNLNNTLHTGTLEENNLIKEMPKKLAASNIHIRVIYGSESGNAESLAQGLVNTLHEHGLSATLINPISWHYFDQYLYNNPHHSSLFMPIDEYEEANCNDTNNEKSNNVNNNNNNNNNNNSYSNTNSSNEASVDAAGRTTIKEKWMQQKELKRRNLPIYIFVVSTTGVGNPPSNYMTLYYEMERLSERYVAQQVPSTSTRASHNLLNEVKQESSVTNDNENSDGSNSVKANNQSSSINNNITPAPPFAGIRYAVFGLGDSSYKNYNRCALMTKKFLQNGGGEEICRIGFGDAVKRNEEEVFDHWQHNLIVSLRDKCRFALTDKHSELLSPRPEMRLRFYPSGKVAPLAFPLPSSPAWPSAQKPIPLHLISRNQVSETREDEHGSAVYHLTFDIHDARCVYQGGDHFGIYATNPQTVVERCAALFELTDEMLSMPVELVRTLPPAIRTVQSPEQSLPTSHSLHPPSSETADTSETKTSEDKKEEINTELNYQVQYDEAHGGNVLPARVPLREVLSRYVDLCGKPKKAVLQTLCKYCTKPEEKLAFTRLITSPAHTTTASLSFAESSVDQLQFRTVLDYLEHFPSCRGISLGHFLEIMPRIQPRYYSIASDSLSEPDRIEIYVRETMDGLASPFLCHRLSVHENQTGSNEKNVNYSESSTGGAVNKSEKGNTVIDKECCNVSSTECVYAFVRQSQFHHPTRLTKQPLIMIAAGTGVAGLIGMCRRREGLMRKLQLQNKECIMMSSKQQNTYNKYHNNISSSKINSSEEMNNNNSDNNDSNNVKCHNEKLSQKVNTTTNTQVGPCVLFFGTRNRNGEYFVKDKLERWALCHHGNNDNNSNDNSNSVAKTEHNEQLYFPVITLLECAFSRDQSRKEYVTDLLYKHEDYIYSLLSDEVQNKNEKCVLYVSGDVTNMAKSVDQVLVEMLQRKKSISRIEAINFLQKMESERRFLKDVY